MADSTRKPDDTDEDGYIYRPYITLRNGRRLFAWECGKTVFRFKPRRKG